LVHPQPGRLLARAPVEERLRHLCFLSASLKYEGDAANRAARSFDSPLSAAASWPSVGRTVAERTVARPKSSSFFMVQ
ncbi:MAG: hypothetical protein M3505_08910, partial [Verrucomicrobiota bacterium]|nr:hypothetical protein [Verrucomicrobiota bacterium]